MGGTIPKDRDNENSAQSPKQSDSELIRLKRLARYSQVQEGSTEPKVDST